MLSPDKYPIPIKPMSGAEENRHFLRAFIQTYRDLPVLWDTSLRDYTNRDKRAEAYEQLVPIYRYLKRDATVEDVKKKINTLRTNYRKELKVVECARRSGSLHQPRCWTFHELDFLRNTEKFLAVNPSTKSDIFSFSENSQSQASFIDASHTAGGGYSYRSVMGGGGNHSSVQSPPSITEMFQKSFGHTQKLEPEPTPPPASAATTSTPQHSGGHASYQHQQQQQQQPDVKRQRLSTASAQSSDELLNIACDYLSGTFPEEESIARTWTHKLKRMQREQRLFAEKFINEILFEGESGTLHRGSVQINAFEPFVRFEEQNSEEHAKSQSPSVHTSSLVVGAQETEAKSVSSNENVTVATATTVNGGCESNSDNFGNYNT